MYKIDINSENQIEVWKDVVGFEGYYQVNNKGNVKSLSRFDRRGRFWEGKIKAQTIGSDGYRYVALQKDNSGRKYAVHRLVAMAFIPNPENKPEVNHIDENRINNCIENLNWCTPLENCNHGTRNIKISQNTNYKSVSEKKKIPIIQYSLEGIFVMKWESADDAAKQLKIQRTGICCCLNGTYKSSGGYIWRYQTDKIENKIVEYKTKKYRKIDQYTLDGNYVRTWNSIKEASENLGISKSGIRSCLEELYKQSGGFIWKDSEVLNG